MRLARQLGIAAALLAPFASGAAGSPRPVAQTHALAPLAGTFVSTGTTIAQPGAPATATRGRARCRWTFGDLWLSCDLEHTTGSGRHAESWSGRLTLGWDLQQQGYRALVVGSFGSSMYLAGRLDGRQLVLDSRGEYRIAGRPTQTRFSFDFTRPTRIRFTEERSVRGGPWQKIESALFVRK